MRPELSCSLDIEATRPVAADAEEAFAFLADLENHWLIAGRCVQVIDLDGPPGGRSGGRVRLRGPFGLRRTARTRVEFARWPEAIGGRAEMSGGTVAHVRWLLRRADARTFVTLGARIDNASALDRLLLRLGGRAWLRSRFDGALIALAAHVGVPTTPTTPATRRPSRHERAKAGVAARALAQFWPFVPGAPACTALLAAGVARGYGAMRSVLATEHGARLYEQRAQLIEPIFADTKTQPRLRPLLYAEQDSRTHRMAPDGHHAQPALASSSGALIRPGLCSE